MNFLKEHKDEWFSFDELKEGCPEANRQPLARLIRWNFVKVKYENVSRHINFLDKGKLKVDKLIAFYKYNDETQEED